MPGGERRSEKIKGRGVGLEAQLGIMAGVPGGTGPGQEAGQ